MNRNVLFALLILIPVIPSLALAVWLLCTQEKGGHHVTPRPAVQAQKF